jgi:retron-type reverse transcriptase
LQLGLLSEPADQLRNKTYCPQAVRRVWLPKPGGYFDSIPHAELMRSVARRVSDGSILALIKQWLVAPVEEACARGKVRRTNRNRDERRGTPQWRAA